MRKPRRIKRSTLTPKQILGLLQSYDFKCFYCDADLDYRNVNLDGGEQKHIDHFQPMCAGGIDEYFNLRPACRWCNFYKDQAYFGDSLAALALLKRQIHALRETFGDSYEGYGHYLTAKADQHKDTIAMLNDCELVNTLTGAIISRRTKLPDGSFSRWIATQRNDFISHHAIGPAIDPNIPLFMLLFTWHDRPHHYLFGSMADD